jgi:hypothetical protein
MKTKLNRIEGEEEGDKEKTQDGGGEGSGEGAKTQEEGSGK